MAASSIEKRKTTKLFSLIVHGAGDEARTRYLHLGKVALYQMSYARRYVNAFRRFFRKNTTKPFGLIAYGAGDEARTRYLHLGKVALYQMSYARRTVLIICTLAPFVNTVF